MIEIGECWVERIMPPGGLDTEIHVRRADPRIRIHADLLQEVSIATERGEDEWASLRGDVLTIRGTNRTVIYRVDYTDWDANDDSYLAEWPD